MYVGVGAAVLPPAGFDPSRPYVPCGNVKATQTMLADLGYYNGPIDGQFGSGSILAAKRFAADNNISIQPDLTRAFCDRLLVAWTAKKQAVAPQVLPPAPAPPQQPPPGVVDPPSHLEPVPPPGPAPAPVPKQSPAGMSTATKYALGGAGFLFVAGIVVLVVRRSS